MGYKYRHRYTIICILCSPTMPIIYYYMHVHIHTRHTYTQLHTLARIQTSEFMQSYCNGKACRTKDYISINHGSIAEKQSYCMHSCGSISGLNFTAALIQLQCHTTLTWASNTLNGLKVMYLVCLDAWLPYLLHCHFSVTSLYKETSVCFVINSSYCQESSRQIYFVLFHTSYHELFSRCSYE